MKVTELVPWLVRSHASYWGEFLFVEVRTDEGITGWGEITSTTKTANRAVAAVIRQLNDLLVGDDPASIELTWHKVFRAFTYTGSRGAASNVTSAVDIALWDIRGKTLGLPVAELLGGPVRPDLLLYTHPDQSRFGTSEGWPKRSAGWWTRVTWRSSSTPSRTPTTCPRRTTATSTAGCPAPTSTGPSS